MEPDTINKWYNLQGKRVRALGVLPEGIYIETDRRALVSGGLIREFVRWCDLEPADTLNVLVACEESQEVCKAFRELGHRAFSCDLQECSGGRPEWHVVGDVLAMIDGERAFTTQDGMTHYQPGAWDLVVAHPPCTYLTNGGAVRLYDSPGVLNAERYAKGLDAKAFFLRCLNCTAQYKAVENPAPARVFDLPRYSQIVNPYEFGHHYKKRTCLWLVNLPPLMPTYIASEGLVSWVSGGSKNGGVPRSTPTTNFRDGKRRSKTFPGIAHAMAEQWADYIISDRKYRESIKR